MCYTLSTLRLGTCSSKQAIPNSQSPILTMPSETQPGPLGPAPPAGQYTDLPTIKAALQAHGRDNGYAIAVDSSTKHRAGWICSKGGKYNDKNKLEDVYESKRRRNTGTTKTDCPFRVSTICGDVNSNWNVKVVNCNHNHDAVASLTALPHHRRGEMTIEERQKVIDMHQISHSPTQILQTLRLANPTSCLILRDIYNLLHSLRVEELARETTIEWLLKVYYFNIKCFMYYS